MYSFSDAKVEMIENLNTDNQRKVNQLFAMHQGYLKLENPDGYAIALFPEISKIKHGEEDDLGWKLSKIVAKGSVNEKKEGQRVIIGKFMETRLQENDDSNCASKLRDTF